MDTSIRYVVLYENDKASDIGRIISDTSGLRGEILSEGGKWVEWKGVLDVLFSPGYGDIISHEEAITIAADLGMTL